MTVTPKVGGKVSKEKATNFVRSSFLLKMKPTGYEANGVCR